MVLVNNKPFLRRMTYWREEIEKNIVDHGKLFSDDAVFGICSSLSCSASTSVHETDNQTSVLFLVFDENILDQTITFIQIML